jgi:transcriptional regulator with XRE-family HTH domain
MALKSNAVSSEGRRRAALREFLMGCRARLTPQDVGLSSVGRRRVPGLRREEVAELAGITPAWYTQLETGSDIRVSPRMLDRVASALRLSDEEKVYLFSLAIVELSVLPCLQPQSHAVLKAFTSLRSLSRRLWAATTVEEALTLAREHCARKLPASSLVTAIHTGLGKWEIQRTGRTAAIRSTLEISSYIVANWPPALRDELHLIGILKHPGQVLARSKATMSTGLALHFSSGLERVKWPALEQVFMAAVHSRNGFVARLEAIHDRQQPSRVDLAMLSAVADLTSLALADAPG